MQVKREEGKKSAFLLFTCNLLRAIHLEVLPNHTNQMFIHALKYLLLEEGDQK